MNGVQVTFFMFFFFFCSACSIITFAESTDQFKCAITVKKSVIYVSPPL